MTQLSKVFQKSAMAKAKTASSSDSVQLQFLLGSSIRRKNRAAKLQQQQQQQQLLPSVRIIAPHRSWSNVDIDGDDFYGLTSAISAADRLRPPNARPETISTFRSPKFLARPLHVHKRYLSWPWASVGNYRYTMEGECIQDPILEGGEVRGQ